MLIGEQIIHYKIGIYVRESRDDNEENFETIETQRDLLVDFVEKSKMGEITGLYIDDNVSGAGFDRKGIERLKKDAKTKAINLLIIKDLSRLGRNNAKTLLFLDYLEECGVKVITFDGKYDSARDNDTVGIDTWYNERYIKDISKKIRLTLRFKIEKGEYLGHAPYGYIKSLDQRNKLSVDEMTAPVIKEIFILYKKGFGYATIAKGLNERGYPAPSMRNNHRGSTVLWNGVAVQRILKNRVYIGDTVQGISEKVSFKSKKTRRLSADRWVISPNTHEPIISLEDFEEVKKIRESKANHAGQHKGKLHLLKGLLYCGKCGDVMFARQRPNRPMSYICSSYCQYGKKLCTSHSIRESIIEEIIKIEIENLLSDSEINTKVRTLLDENLLRKDDWLNEINKLEQTLFSKQRQQDVLYMDRLEGKISDQLFIRTNLAIENRISKIRHEIEKIRNRKREEKDQAEMFDEIFDSLSHGDFTNEMIKLVVDRIVILDVEDDLIQYGLTEEQVRVINASGGILIYFKF